MMIWLCLSAHVIICMLTAALIKKKKIHVDAMAIPIVFFIPIWGILLVIAHEIYFFNKGNKVHDLEVDHIKLVDKKYRFIELENRDNADIVVPLEEAIQVNDAKTRRALMLDILHENPNNYLGLFQRAKMSDDTEITHYATTTIMEIQSEYENRIQFCENALKEDSSNEAVLREYLEVMKKYIDSGLLSGNILQIQKEQLEKILDQLLSIHDMEKELVLLKIEISLEISKMDKDSLRIKEQQYYLKRAKELWPNEERVYMLLVNYYRHLGKPEMIQAVFFEVEDQNIYLSHEGRTWYSFWTSRSRQE